jgi:hypothetical protein
MKKYLGVKIIQAKPQQREKWMSNKYEDRDDHSLIDGYKVVYEDGYVSWSPKEVFEKAYKEVLRDANDKLGLLVDPNTSEWEIIGHVAKIGVQIEEQKQSQSKEDFDIIKSCLDQAKVYGLEIEVIHQALQEMKGNPSLLIEQAMVYGLNEWVK